MSVYDRLRATAQRLLATYQTGTTSRLVITTVPAANEWGLDTVTTDPVAFDAFVTGVPSKLVDGSRVLMSDRVVIVAGDVPLTASDNITIDGHGVEVVSYEAIPAAGDPVLRKLIVRG